MNCYVPPTPVKETARTLREQYQEDGQTALEFGHTIHSLSSAIGHLKELAAKRPSVARHYTTDLAALSDELGELVGKLEPRLNLVAAE